jgi:hypothetical protein
VTTRPSTAICNINSPKRLSTPCATPPLLWRRKRRRKTMRNNKYQKVFPQIYYCWLLLLFCLTVIAAFNQNRLMRDRRALQQCRRSLNCHCHALNLSSILFILFLINDKHTKLILLTDVDSFSDFFFYTKLTSKSHSQNSIISYLFNF